LGAALEGFCSEGGEASFCDFFFLGMGSFQGTTPTGATDFIICPNACLGLLLAEENVSIKARYK